MEKQNPHRTKSGTGCNTHRADDAAQPNQNSNKKQDNRSRYAGRTLSLFYGFKAGRGGDTMNAFTGIRKADDIQTFLPGIGEEEHQLRAKVGSMRNCAAAMIAKTESDTARALAWICSDYAVSHVYAGATHAELTEIIRFCNRLLITAMQAEAIDESGRA